VTAERDRRVPAAGDANGPRPLAWSGDVAGDPGPTVRGGWPQVQNDVVPAATSAQGQGDNAKSKAT
jgi:hypothetical protein